MPPQDTAAEIQALRKTITRLMNVYFILAVAVTVYVFNLDPEITKKPFTDLPLPWFGIRIPGTLVSTFVPVLLGILLSLIAVFSRDYRRLHRSAAVSNGVQYSTETLRHDMLTGYPSVDRLVNYLWLGRDAKLIFYRAFYFVFFVVVKTVFYAGPLLVSTYVFYRIFHNYADVPPANNPVYLAIFKIGYLLAAFAIIVFYFDYGAAVFGEIFNHVRKILTRIIGFFMKGSRGIGFNLLCGLFEGVLIILVPAVIVCASSYLVAVRIISFLPDYNNPWEFAAVCPIPALFAAALIIVWVFIFRDYFWRRSNGTD